MRNCNSNNECNLGSGCFGGSVQDVVFVIDTSGSIGSSRFELIREFTANITTELINSSPDSAVGVILFASSAYLHFNLQTYTSLNALLSAIYNLPYSSGGTDTAEALNLLLTTAQNGALGLRNDSSKVAIVITDGHSNNHYATSSAADALHASNIFDVYAVGVGGADQNELEAIASSPEFVFFTSSFDNTGLQELLDTLLQQLCDCKHLHMYNYITYMNDWHKLCNLFCMKFCSNDYFACLIYIASFLRISFQPSGFYQNTVGYRQDVICSVNLPPDIDPDAVELYWLNEDDIITDDGRVTIDKSSDYYNDSSLVTIIQFDPLFEDDEGEYVCYAVINGSFTFESINLQNFASEINMCIHIYVT